MKFSCAGILVLVPQSCLTLCDPINCSPLGFSVHGILQARILEWIAMPSLQGIFPTQGLNPSLLHCRWTLPFEPQGKAISWQKSLRVNVSIRQNIDLLIFWYGFGVTFKLCMINKCSEDECINNCQLLLSC